VIGNQLREIRKERKMTQKQLAGMLNLAKSTISQYENNINEPDLKTLMRLADLFEVSTDYLLGRSSERVIHSVDASETQHYNVVYFGSEREILNDIEAMYLRESLAVYRRVR